MDSAQISEAEATVDTVCFAEKLAIVFGDARGIMLKDYIQKERKNYGK